MFRQTTRTIAAAAALTVLFGTGSVLARSKDGHSKGKKEPRLVQIGPGGSVAHPGNGVTREDGLANRAHDGAPKKGKKHAFGIVSITPGGSIPLPDDGPSLDGGLQGNRPDKGNNLQNTKDIDIGVLVLAPTGSGTTVDQIDATDVNRSSSPTSFGPARIAGAVDSPFTGSARADALVLDGAAVVERPSLRLPRLLDRASFSITRDGETGLAADGAWTFQF